MGHVKIHFAMISYQGVHHFAYFRCIGHEPCCRCPENVVIKSHRLPPFLPPETLIGQQSILVECTPRRKPYWAATDAVGMHFCSDLSGASVPLVVAGQSSRVFGAFGDAKTHQKRHVTWRTLYTLKFQMIVSTISCFFSDDGDDDDDSLPDTMLRLANESVWRNLSVCWGRRND